MPTTLTARRLLTEAGPIDFPLILIDEGCIVRIEAGPPNAAAETLTSAFFDIHVHGAMSYDFMAATAPEILQIGKFLARCGVAHYLATTVTGPIDTTLTALDTLATAIDQPPEHSWTAASAAPVGIHLEGPFLSYIRRGVHPQAHLLAPSIALFDRLQAAARGHIRLITLAPELPGALELVAHAASRGVCVSLGHSDATAAETLAALAAGAVSATHCFNAMRPLNHREPGILGTVLDRHDLFAELICDGVHVDPAMVRLWLRMKGEDRAILVTDGMSATGMPDGTYRLGDLEVEVKGGVCLLHGTLAGSVLTMDRAVANLQRFTGSSLGRAVQLASRNPARLLGMETQTATAAGNPANFNIYNDANQLTGTILHGRKL
jgi:N-acetylglucosamine-6-phosphate deacetylase